MVLVNPMIAGVEEKVLVESLVVVVVLMKRGRVREMNIVKEGQEG